MARVIADRHGTYILTAATDTIEDFVFVDRCKWDGSAIVAADQLILDQDGGNLFEHTTANNGEPWTEYVGREVKADTVHPIQATTWTGGNGTLRVYTRDIDDQGRRDGY